MLQVGNICMHNIYIDHNYITYIRRHIWIIFDLPTFPSAIMAIFDETKRSSSVFFFPGRQNRRFSNSWWIKGWFLVAPNLQLRNHPSFALYREPQEKTWHEHSAVQQSMKKTRISCCEKGEDLIKTFNTIQICLLFCLILRTFEFASAII